MLFYPAKNGPQSWKKCTFRDLNNYETCLGRNFITQLTLVLPYGFELSSVLGKQTCYALEPLKIEFHCFLACARERASWAWLCGVVHSWLWIRISSEIFSFWYHNTAVLSFYWSKLDLGQDQNILGSHK